MFSLQHCEVYRPIQAERRVLDRSQARTALRGVCEYSSHPVHLYTLLFIIVLIDTHGIDPDRHVRETLCCYSQRV